MSTNTNDTLKIQNILNLQNDNVEKVQAMEGFVKGTEGLGIVGVFVNFFRQRPRHKSQEQKANKSQVNNLSINKPSVK